MQILLVEFFEDEFVLLIERLLLSFDLVDSIVKFVLAIFCLFQFDFNVAWALGFFDFPLDQGNFVVNVLFLVLGEILGHLLMFQFSQSLGKVFTAALQRLSVLFNFLILGEVRSTVAFASWMDSWSSSPSLFLSVLTSFSLSRSCWTSLICELKVEKTVSPSPWALRLNLNFSALMSF